MKNIRNKKMMSLICLLAICAGNLFAKETSVSAESSRSLGWVSDRHFSVLEISAVCQAKDSKHATWTTWLRSTSGSIIHVEARGKAVDISPYSSAQLDAIEAKTCGKPVELKLDARHKGDKVHYALEYKDGNLKAHEKQPFDWSGFTTGMLMATNQAMAAKMQNDAQIAQIRAQQQAAAQARALQVAQMQAAYAQQVAAQQQAQAAQAQQAAAQRAAQAAQQQAQAAAQLAANQRAAQAASASRSTSGTYSGGSSYTSNSRSSQPALKASDIGITQNYVGACYNGATNANYEISNNSYSNASVTVQMSYQTGGVQYQFNATHNIGPRSANDYSQQIPCSDQAQLSDYGHSAILQWQFY